jgi:hypothetical protein
MRLTPLGMGTLSEREPGSLTPRSQGEPRRRPGPRWWRQAIPYTPAALLVPAGALGVAALLDRGPLRAHKGWAGVLSGAAALGIARWQLARHFTEQPEYTVEARHPGLEVRRYAARVVAETIVDDREWRQSLDEGFRRLAGYIFGGNTKRQPLAMTAPVNASPRRETIGMTAPVTARPDQQGLTVAFTMPRQRTLSSLPAPVDPRVHLREQEAQRMAVVRFRGRYREERKNAMEAELLRRVRDADLDPVGPPVFAGYDAPSTLPLLRRVEMWVPVA